MTLTELEEAAFWERKVCLACQTINEDDADNCGECGSEQLLAAKTALVVVGLIETEE